MTKPASYLVRMVLFCVAVYGMAALVSRLKLQAQPHHIEMPPCVFHVYDPDAGTSTVYPCRKKPASPMIIPDDMRVASHVSVLLFAPGSADLPSNAAAALKPICTASSQVTVETRAPTDPHDPSAAMHLSLSRALAVQAALTSCGVPPQNILPRADGGLPGQNEDETIIGSFAEN